ncbi:hypothetical protein ARMSODRAFT_949087, partial [Armillaria solidipes]
MASTAILDQVPCETLQALLSSIRSSESSNVESLFKPGDVVELQGPSASGKSHFLWYIIIRCILPTFHDAIRLDGWAKAAVLFDTDSTFDVCRFRTILSSHLAKLGVPAVSIGPAIQAAMSNFHIFRPGSSMQLVASLVNLPTYHAISLSASEIGLVAVDSMSTFYWSDRFAVEQLRSFGKVSEPSSSVYPLHNIATVLERFHVSHNPLIILTNWGLNLESSSPFYKQHLYPFPSNFTTEDRPSMAKFSSNPPLASPLSLTAHITFTPARHRQTGPLSTDQQTENFAEIECICRFVDRDQCRFRIKVTSEDVSL